MNKTQVVVEGILQPDGRLEVAQSIDLPPGPVEITIKPAGPRESTWAVLERIWAESKALGLTPRSAEEIDADLNALRGESKKGRRL